MRDTVGELIAGTYIDMPSLKFFDVRMATRKDAPTLLDECCEDVRPTAP